MNDNNNNDDVFDAFSGPIDVNGDITPITKRVVKQVTPHLWNDMSTGELYDQQIILYERLDIAIQLQHDTLIKQLQRGVDQIDRLINAKVKKTKENILI